MSQFANLIIPPFHASAARLAEIKARHKRARMTRQLFEGKWQQVLIGLEKTRHKFGDVVAHNGRITQLIQKINLVALAMDMHASVMAANPVQLSVPDGFETQRIALDEIRRRSLFDAMFHQAVRTANIESEAPLIIDVDANGDTLIRVGCPEEWLPVGTIGPDGQPSVWERRWVREVASKVRSDKPKRYLRIERHRTVMADGRSVGIVEQLAYKLPWSSIYHDTAKLEEATLDEALSDIAPESRPDPVRLTGASQPLIVRLVLGLDRGEPVPRLNDDDLDLVDASTAAFSRLDRSHEMHAHPKMRVSESMLDPETGRVPPFEAVVDPDGEVGYITTAAQFTAQLDILDRTLEWLLVTLRIAPSLLGIKLSGGATPDSYDKLRLESTNTLAAARGSEPYMTTAVERVATVASEFDSRRGTGYAISPVGAALRPEIPKDETEVGREQRDLVTAGLTSSRRAIARIHGDDQVDAVLAEIAEDRKNSAEYQSAAIFGAALPSGSGGDT